MLLSLFTICVLLSVFRIVDDAMYRDDDKFCLVEMEVRDCELDQYGLVSSDVYVDYLENGRQHCNMGCASASRSIITSPISFLFLLGSYLAREVFASRLGIGRDSIARTGNALALSEQKLNYYTPLKVRNDNARALQAETR